MKYFRNTLLTAAYYSKVWMNISCLHIFQLLKILISLKLIHFQMNFFVWFTDSSLNINSQKLEFWESLLLLLS